MIRVRVAFTGAGDQHRDFGGHLLPVSQSRAKSRHEFGILGQIDRMDSVSECQCLADVMIAADRDDPHGRVEPRDHPRGRSGPRGHEDGRAGHGFQGMFDQRGDRLGRGTGFRLLQQSPQIVQTASADGGLR
jgi:hypothetical protein